METGTQAFPGVDLIQDFVVAPLQVALNQLSTFVPVIVGALLILLVGGLITKTLEQLLVDVLELVTLDKLADQIQLSSILARGGIKRKLSELIGAIVYWIVMLAYVMAALDALNLTVAAQLF